MSGAARKRGRFPPQIGTALMVRYEDQKRQCFGSVQMQHRTRLNNARGQPLPMNDSRRRKSEVKRDPKQRARICADDLILTGRESTTNT